MRDGLDWRGSRDQADTRRLRPRQLTAILNLCGQPDLQAPTLIPQG